MVLPGLTPRLTGAGGPTGPQGTNKGHENGEAMALVGVHVEPPVRLRRVVETAENSCASVKFTHAFVIFHATHAWQPQLEQQSRKG